MARGRPKKKVEEKVVEKAVKPVKDERAAVMKKLLTDPNLPTKEEFELGGRDVQRHFSTFEKDHREEMAKYGIGMTSLMEANSNKHEDWGAA